MLKGKELYAILGALAVGLATGWFLAYDRGVHKGTTTERENAKVVTAELITKLNDANAQIDKANQSASDRIASLTANFASESAERLKAQQSMAAAIKTSATNANATWSSLQELREVLRVSTDQCTRAGVDPAVLKLFNDAIAASFQPKVGDLRASRND